MKVEKGSRVRLEYELRVKGGEVVESSAKHGAIEYVHGESPMLPGLAKRLVGARAGVEIRGEIPGVDAFGNEESFPTTKLPRSALPKDAAIAKGASFEAKSATGDPVVLRVVDLSADEVTVRLVPPIAGKDLEFRAKILMIEDPATHQREVVDRKPPPPPAAALKLDVRDE